MARKLASIQTIDSIEPIEGADKIELTSVLGWQCICKKGDFKVGDKCIYFEIDSICPEHEIFEFLRPRKFKVKTIKLRGQLSQGLALPANWFFQESYIPTLKIGADVTEALNIKKKEEQIIDGNMYGLGKIRRLGDFPNHLIMKTDEDRVQSYPGVLKEIQGLPYYAALKYDGTSITVINDVNEGFLVCSRNLMIKAPEQEDWFNSQEGNVYWKAVEKYDLKNNIPLGYAIQAELCGPKIQGNPLELNDINIYIFNVWDLTGKRYLDYHELTAFCTSYKLPQVEIIRDGEEFPQITVQEILAWAEVKYPNGKNAEGIVIRPKVGRHSRVLGHRLSFKVISNTYLLNEKEVEEDQK